MMRTGRSRTLLVLVLLLTALSSTASAQRNRSRDTDRAGKLADQFQAAAEALSADAMEGRGLETDGITLAADWLEAYLQRMELYPAFGDSYRQAFDVKTGVTLADGNELDGVAEDDWTPLGFSSSGTFSGQLVFAGYGVEAAEVGYQELEGLDLEGKVVLMLRYEPQEKDEGSPFRGKKPSRWSAMRYKVLQARERGAAAVVFVTGPLQDEGEERLPALKNDGPKSPAGLPVIQVTTSTAQKWLDAADINLEEFQHAIDRDLTPRSQAISGVRIKGTVALDAHYTRTENVVGLLPGRGALKDEYVVIGAHYDHLGYGGAGSMRPNVTAIHNGADDNASGVVGALLATRRVRRALRDVAEHRTVIVALFSAEEVGLAGSSHFVEDPPLPMENCVAMLNLDMIGRLRDDTLVALGSESAEEWMPLIDDAATKAQGMTISSHGDGYGPSDHTSFYASGVPVLHLFTGAHDEYHAPEDKADLLNAQGAVQVVEFTAALARNLAVEETRLTYARSTSGPAMAGDSRGYGAYLGTIPDYRSMEATEGGVLLSDVRAGGPADKGGIRGGDRIIGMAGTRIENLYDMTYALQDNKPGDTIEVVVVRGEEQLSLQTTLGDRDQLSAQSGAAAAHAAPAEEDDDEETKAASDAATEPAHTPPPSPHGGDMPGAIAAPGGIAAFYENRPGADFVIGAGKPFARTSEGEKHLAEIRQLTFGGENAEAYFSPDGRQLIFQATPSGVQCDRQYVMDLANGDIRQVSTGTGRTTCGYFDFPEADRIIYASTHGADDACPPPPDFSQGYVWALYDSFELYTANPDGTDVRQLTDSPGYDAEATWCHRGGKFLFTSVRDGDLELYVSDEAGNIERLTDTPGYDGGAFYSPDCSEIVWRAGRPEGEALDHYRRLLDQGLIQPSALEIFVMKEDGTDVRQLTDNGVANFCPTFTADGAKIIFASNVGSDSGREFDMWLVDKTGGEPERVTTAPGFDGFPQFSPDGRWLVWASNRAEPEGRETNLFLARWVE